MAKKNLVSDTKEEIKKEIAGLQAASELAVAGFTGGNNHNGDTPPPERLTDMLVELNSLLHGKDDYGIDQKSDISGINAEGMLQAENLNAYLKKYYGFEVESLNMLIQSKLRKSKSVDGKQLDRIIKCIDALKAMQEIRLHTPTPADNMLGRV